MKVDQTSMIQPDSMPGSDSKDSLPWKRLLLLAVLGSGLAILLVYPFSLASRSWSELFNLAHMPCFFAEFLLIAGVLDPSCVGLPASWCRVLRLNASRLILLVVALTIIGITCEVLQEFVGRSPSVSDVLANGCGLAAALFWCLGRPIASRVRRVGLTLIAAGLLITPSWSPIAELYDCSLQQRAFPILSSFERTRELHTWAAHEATIARATEWSTHGQMSMKVQGRAGSVHPGATFQWPMTDWTGYTTLELDLLNPSDEPMTLRISISDEAHAASGFAPTDRFRTSIELPPGKPTPVRIQLANVLDAPETRDMDLSRIHSVNLFTVRPETDFAFLVDHVRLTNEGD